MDLPTPQPVPPPVILPQQPTPQKKPLRGLLLLEVGFFEVAFVVVLLGAVFGVLNYFNILSLSHAIPLFSFLPHLPTASQPIPQSNLLSVSPTGPFVYDARNAQSLIQKFANQTLTASFLPKSQASESAFFYIQNKNVFTSPWNIENGKVGTASAFINAQEILTLQEDSNNPIFYQIILQSFSPPIMLLPTTKAQDVANVTAEKVLKEDLSKATWKCQENGQSVCTLVKNTSSGTTQYSINMQLDAQATATAVLSILACSAPPGYPITNCSQ